KKFLDTLNNEEEKNKILHGILKHKNETSRENFEYLLAVLVSKSWEKVMRGMKSQIQEAKNRGDCRQVNELLSTVSRMKQTIQKMRLI
ncbi:hypothetical protein ACFLY6_03485, partial [Candidatus Dependentiae bacterium]